MSLISQHDIDEFLKTGAYALSIKVLRGRNQISLTPEILGLSPEASSEFTKQGITKNSITILRSLKKAGEYLENKRRRIQRDYIFRSGGMQFVHQKDMEAVWLEIKAMEHERTVALEELEGSKYEEDLTNFKSRMITALEAVHGTENYPKIIEIVESATKKFPTMDEIKQSFRIEVIGPFTVQSVAELAEEDAKLAENLAIKAEQNAIAEFKIAQAKQVEQHLAAALVTAKSEILNVVAAELTRLDDLGEANLPAKFQSKFKSIYQKFERLSEFDSTLTDLTEKMSDLNGKLGESDTPEFKDSLHSFKTSIEEFKTQVESTEITACDSLIF